MDISKFGLFASKIVRTVSLEKALCTLCKMNWKIIRSKKVKDKKVVIWQNTSYELRVPSCELRVTS